MIRGEGEAIIKGVEPQEVFDFVLDPAQYTKAATKIVWVTKLGDTSDGMNANPPGYSDTVDHQTNFYNAVRSRKPVAENEVFGNNAAIGCHLANFAYFNKAVAVWDPKR